MYQTIHKLVQQIKECRPLILNITNFVTMDFVANGLLSLGASPIMSLAIHEMRDLIHMAHAVVINIGTLNDEFITLADNACAIAHALKKPIIFDPVGAGASLYRSTVCLDLLEKHPFAILRGNASEIMALCGTHRSTKGVDANISSLSVIEQAKQFSQERNMVLAISGKTDLIISPEQIAFCERGSSLMPMITGSGCLLTAVIAAFQTVHHDPFIAAQSAIHFYNVCGEIAALQSSGPGSFKTYFMDALAKLPVRDDYEPE
jgi:hydroxyethylthiazole kinase